MNNNEPKRISRLTAIITQLQTKRLVTATELAAKFAVSVRTIYRDIRALVANTVNIAINPNIPRPLLYGAITGAYHLVGIVIVSLIVVFIG